MFTLIALLPFLLHGLAGLVATMVVSSLQGTFLGPVAWAAAPAAYVLALLGFAVACALPVAGRIRPGRFRRASEDRHYLTRRWYGAAWTTLYYCKPVLSLALSVAPLRRAVLRGFGYRGSANVTLYPDSWVRDLPLLELGEDVYIANRATLGTNVVSGDRIVVDRIRLGARTVIGHLALVGGGLVAGEDVEVGPGAAVGFQVRLGDGVRIGGRAVVGHRTRIGAGTCLGLGVHVGDRCRLAGDLKIPDGTILPTGTHLRSQADVDAFAPFHPGAARTARIPADALIPADVLISVA